MTRNECRLPVCLGHAVGIESGPLLAIGSLDLDDVGYMIVGLFAATMGAAATGRAGLISADDEVGSLCSPRGLRRIGLRFTGTMRGTSSTIRAQCVEAGALAPIFASGC